MADIEWCDGFLNLVDGQDKIEGEAKDAEFEGCIEIISFEFGSSQGFDDEGTFAEQRVERRRESAFNNFLNANPEAGISTLFGDESVYGTPDSLSEGEVNEFQGQDLAEVDACQFEVTKLLDLSSPDLFRAYCSSHTLVTREVFDTATVSLRKAAGSGRQVYLIFSFTEVVVIGYTLQIDSAATPRETVTFSFGSCVMQYKPQNNDGTLGTAVRSGWNFIDRAAM
ncbi:MAG: type VI secretion system tube protein Hcp [Planctomycetota bacterium]|nr:type VI secretion system tube protein Hcp [Planctomycetota bacterium]